MQNHSQRIVASFLLCKTKARFQLADETGTRSAFEALEIEMEARLLGNVINNAPRDAVLKGVELNNEALVSGAAVIADSVLQEESGRFQFPLLLKRRGRSALGNFMFVPALVHGGYAPPAHARQILSVSGQKIAKLQKSATKFGIIVHASEEGSRVRSISLSSSSQEAKRILLAIENLKEVPPRLILNSHCESCEFRSRCLATASEADDLSLLRTLKPAEVRKYANRGILTVNQLSYTFRAKRNHSGASRLTRQHALQAKAVRDRRLYVLGTPSVPSAGTEIYIDFEADTERNFVYLIGVLINQGASYRHVSFWARERKEEVKIVTELLTLLRSLGQFIAFSYGAFESNWVKRWSKIDDYAPLCELLTPILTNVLGIIYSHIYFPTYSNGLKDIASSLGFVWRDQNASGLQSVVWRRNWEQSHDDSLKHQLVRYNEDDCLALRTVTAAIRCAIRNEDERLPWGIETVSAKPNEFTRRQWETPSFHLPEFDFINQRARFDYQRDRIYLRVGTTRRRKVAKQPQAPRFSVKSTHEETITLDKCPNCDRPKLKAKIDKRLLKVQYDVCIRPSGIRRVVKYFRTAKYYCAKCKQSFISSRHDRLKRYGYALHCLVAFYNIAHRTTLASISIIFKETLGIPIPVAQVYVAKCELRRVQQPLVEDSLARILSGDLIHADETEIKVRGIGKAYIWVLTSMYDVVYFFRETRETSFLKDLLQNFRGVLVSDFYNGYDSMPCKQQRCLIHLIRDLNQDIRLHPYDTELRELTQRFGTLLKLIVSEVDKFGLRSSRLQKFKSPVKAFLASLQSDVYASETAEALRVRLIKNQERLFTFMDFDNVPWNNNNAEHAMKYVAWHREDTKGAITADSIKTHLDLLGVYLTCRYREVPYLTFLRSRKLSFAPGAVATDDDTFDLYPVEHIPRRQMKL